LQPQGDQKNLLRKWMVDWNRNHVALLYYCEIVISLQHLARLSFTVATLEEDGVVNIWIVTELPEADMYNFFPRKFVEIIRKGWIRV
jgi:hypothetical protein